MNKELEKVAADGHYLEPSAAVATLQAQVKNPIFFEKLAKDYGVVPANEEEAATYLQMADTLRVAAAAQTEKTAGERLSAVQRMNQQLQASVYGSAAPTSLDSQIKQASAKAALNPAIARAALSLLVSAS